MTEIISQGTSLGLLFGEGNMEATSQLWQWAGIQRTHLHTAEHSVRAPSCTQPSTELGLCFAPFRSALLRALDAM